SEVTSATAASTAPAGVGFLIFLPNLPVRAPRQWQRYWMTNQAFRPVLRGTIHSGEGFRGTRAERFTWLFRSRLSTRGVGGRCPAPDCARARDPELGLLPDRAEPVGRPLFWITQSRAASRCFPFTGLIH